MRAKKKKKRKRKRKRKRLGGDTRFECRLGGDTRFEWRKRSAQKEVQRLNKIFDNNVYPKHFYEPIKRNWSNTVQTVSVRLTDNL